MASQGGRFYTNRITINPPIDAPGDGAVSIYAVTSDPTGILNANPGDRALQAGTGNTWVCLGGTSWTLAASGEVPVQANGGGVGAVVMGTGDRVALCDTTGGAFTLFAPPVASGVLTVRIIAGILPVQINPASPTEGNDGPPASTFLLDPAVQSSAEFVGDTVNSAWWYVA